MAALRRTMQRVYWRAKGNRAVVLNHKPMKVLRLSASNPVALRRSGTRSLHQKLAASWRQ